MTTILDFSLFSLGIAAIFKAISDTSSVWIEKQAVFVKH